jgi:mannose-6-phosphate isomerase-like protein (cupin superfamily)
MQINQPLVVDLNKKPEYQPLLTGNPQTKGMKSGRVYLRAGEECGEHSTHDREEMLVFLSGKGHAVIEKQTLEVGEGKITYIPPRTLHNIKNTSDKPLSYIYCVAPAAECIIE